MRNSTFVALALSTALAMPAPAQFPSYPTVQPTGPADQLASVMRRLAAAPTDLYALIQAGELSVKLDDMSAAAAFFARADKIDGRNGRVKAGMASILVRAERPGEALRYFQMAEGLGLPADRYAADRGLAFDLIGEQERAQRDYRLALRTTPDDETVRRYALSLAISGKQQQALEQLEPLVRRQDRAAWRSRAFALAMNGDLGGANKIAVAVMPAGMAAGLRPFFERLPTLPASDRAFAVHFGEVRPTPARLADALMKPVFPVLGPDPYAPVQVAVAQVAPPALTPRGRGRARGERRERVQLASTRVRSPIPAAAVRPTPTPAPVQATPVAVARATPVPVAPRAGFPAEAAPQPTPPPAARPVATSPVQVAAISTPPRIDNAPPVRVTTISPAPMPAAITPQAGPVQVADTTSTGLPGTIPPVVPASSVAVRSVQLAGSAAPRSATATAPGTPDTLPTAGLASPTPPATASPLPPAVAARTVATPVPVAAPGFTTVGPPAPAPEPVAAVAAASVPVPAVSGEDSILARIVASITIPGEELGITEPARSAPAAARVDPAIERTLAAGKARVAREAADRAAAARTIAVAAKANPAEPKPNARGRRGRAVEEADDVKPGARDKAARDGRVEMAAAGAKRGKAKTGDDEDAKPAAKPRTAAERRLAARKDAEEKAAAKKERPETGRIWVQVAGGANESDLPKAWTAAQKKAAALKGRDAYSTPLRATNRVVTGPFKTEGEARDFVNRLARQGVSAFQFTSAAGQKMTKLPSK